MSGYQTKRLHLNFCKDTAKKSFTKGKTSLIFAGMAKLKFILVIVIPVKDVCSKTQIYPSDISIEITRIVFCDIKLSLNQV